MTVEGPRSIKVFVLNAAVSRINVFADSTLTSRCDEDRVQNITLSVWLEITRSLGKRAGAAATVVLDRAAKRKTVTIRAGLGKEAAIHPTKRVEVEVDLVDLPRILVKREARVNLEIQLK